MGERVLFVDDDQMLLSSMERCLGHRFDISTSLSGAEALRAIERSDRFPVVVTDMRMPLMDGVEFIRRAREIAPDSIYLMLTGNQDLRTATRAVNEGAVTHFLNKPCDPDEIAEAIEGSLQQYEASTSEQDLLQGAFECAAGIAADIVDLTRPEWSQRVERAVAVVKRLRSETGIDPSPEFEVAARVVSIGYALLPADDYRRLGVLSPDDSRHATLRDAAFGIAARIASRLSGLSELTDAILLSQRSDGELPTDDDDPDRELAARVATLLKAAYVVDGLLEHADGPSMVGAVIVRELPEASPTLLHSIEQAVADLAPHRGVRVEIDRLAAGMVLQRDLLSISGEKLMSAGRTLTSAHLEKLRTTPGPNGDGLQVEVTRESFDAATEDAEQDTEAEDFALPAGAE